MSTLYGVSFNLKFSLAKDWDLPFFNRFNLPYVHGHLLGYHFKTGILDDLLVIRLSLLFSFETSRRNM